MGGGGGGGGSGRLRIRAMGGRWVVVWAGGRPYGGLVVGGGGTVLSKVVWYIIR